MKKKATGELILSMLFALVGVASVLIIKGTETNAISNTGATDFSTFPTIFGSILAMLSFINAGRAFRETRKETADNTEVAENAEEKQKQHMIHIRVAIMFALCLAFALLLKKVSFAVLSFVFLFLSFYVLGQKKLLVNALVSLAGSGLIYMVFIVLLKLPL